MLSGTLRLSILLAPALSGLASASRLEIEHTSSLHGHAQESALLFEPVRAALDALTSRPSCYRNATLMLIHDCHSIANDLTEDKKAEYAVALTLCELNTAGVEGPPSCLQGSFQAALCLRSLESKMQWWTSYSGYYRDVTRMCYIARQDDESARVLGLHRNLTSVLDSLLSLFHQGNARAENERRSAFVKEQQLQDDLRAQWDDLGANIDVAKEKMLSQYSDLDQVLQGILFSIQESVQQTFKDVQAQSTDVFERLSHHEIHSMAALDSALSQQLETFLASSSTQTSELSAALTEILMTTQDVFDMSQSLTRTKELVISQQALQRDTYEQATLASHELQNLIQSLPQLSRVATLGQALMDAETGMAAFRQELDFSRETAGKLHEESLAFVHTLVQEVSHSLQHVRSEMDEVEERLSKWTMSSALLPAALVLAVASLSRWSRIAVLCGVFIYLAQFYSHPSAWLNPLVLAAARIRRVQLHAMPLQPQYAVLGSLSFLTLFVVLRRWTRACHARYTRDSQARLPSTHSPGREWQFVNANMESYSRWYKHAQLDSQLA